MSVKLKKFVHNFRKLIIFFSVKVMYFVCKKTTIKIEIGKLRD